MYGEVLPEMFPIIERLARLLVEMSIFYELLFYFTDVATDTFKFIDIVHSTEYLSEEQKHFIPLDRYHSYA